MPDDPRLMKRVDDHTCAACRRPLLPGHRVQPAFIMLDPNARNPDRITERGVELGTDYEFVHCRCSDPYLDGKIPVSL
jgi:hypothetical protein